MSVTNSQENIFKSFLGYLLRSSIAFIIIVLAGEALLRFPGVSPYLLVPSVGTTSRLLDEKLFTLDARMEERDEIPCIIIGSSMSMDGINPDVIQDTLGIECFNFSLFGIGAAGAGGLGPALVQRYQPKILIYATDIRAFVDSESTRNWREIAFDSAWIADPNGEYGLEAWLIENSYLYGQLLALTFWRNPLDVWLTRQADLNITTGFKPGVAGQITFPDQLTEEELERREVLESLLNYQIVKEEGDGLERLRSGTGKETFLVIIEMPVHESAFLFFGNGQNDHNIFIRALENFSESSGTAFIPSFGYVEINEATWVDRFHLSAEGANAFSFWLSLELAKLPEMELLR